MAAALGGRLTVDLGALARNWRALDKVSQGALTAAVVKADGYGTGAAEAARALFAAGARFFFVALPEEAIEVRRAVPQAYIFVLSGLFPGAAALYVEQKLMPVLNSVPMLDEWLAFCLDRREAFPAALHFDTGMNRLGFRLNEAMIVRSKVDALGFQPQMVMSHLACADTPAHEKNRTQLALFQSVLAQFPNIPASFANSAALMSGRDYHFQMVRPGIALFGGRAVNGRKNPMSHVVTLEVPILQIKDARTGETIGYGATQTLDRDSRLAIVSIGYADGFFRALSSASGRVAGRAFVRGLSVPVLGRVSMDTVILDITDLGNDIPLPGEMVEILGPNLTVDDQADGARTIGYEVLTALKMGRFSRHYVGGAQAEN